MHKNSSPIPGNMLKDELVIRKELPTNSEVIATVVASAFGRDKESRLVDLIRSRGEVVLSLLADYQGELIGHVLVSPIKLEPDAEGTYLGLAPLSVKPEFQNKGVGSLLVEETIVICNTLGIDALFLLGSPKYYSRFGFTQSHIKNEYGATISFMQLELKPACLSRLNAMAKYVSAFEEIFV